MSVNDESQDRETFWSVKSSTPTGRPPVSSSTADEDQLENEVFELSDTYERLATAKSTTSLQSPPIRPMRRIDRQLSDSSTQCWRSSSTPDDKATVIGCKTRTALNSTSRLPTCKDILKLYEDLEHSVRDETSQFKTCDSRDGIYITEMNKLKMTIVELEKLCQTRLEEMDDCYRKISALRIELDEKEALNNEIEFERTTIGQELTQVIQNQIQERQARSEELEQLRSSMNKLMSRHALLNKELKESYSNYDYLEIAFNRLKADIHGIEKFYESELELLRERVNDLTSKLTTSQRNLALAKQKLAKHEANKSERKRHLSARTTKSEPTQDQMSKDFHNKLQELESKIAGIQIILLGQSGQACEQIGPSNVDLNQLKSVNDICVTLN